MLNLVSFRIVTRMNSFTIDGGRIHFQWETQKAITDYNPFK